MNEDAKREGAVEEALDRLELNPAWSRRQFLKVSGVAVMGLTVFGAFADGAGGLAPLMIMDQAEGLVIGDPTKCVGCRRCELACTEFNDGKAWPELSRIKMTRNLAYGPKGNFLGQRGQGNFGQGLIVQDLC